ncbi:sulfotransferase family protein [Streptomonospora litoralis]|uniref:Sulfotransferase domain protein n=1 Tax=Streptomonospora litoralis TaxID=2498135 RepID=A0A4P6PY14_9ACTN|nr:sulfotransferase [Streptomonospora litoralis]QBI53108.1 Sulfotransferase domain protein [Streptomonospora litoralis]
MSMDLLRKMNSALGATTGLELRRVRKRPASAATSTVQKKPKKRDVAFRPPENPAVDRLLDRPIFVISPVRSGSTLLRLLLNGHSQLHAPHELHIRRLEVHFRTKLSQRAMDACGLQRGDIEHLLWDRVLHRELVRADKDFIVEKTPSNAFVWKRIAACWPDARFICLLRHPASIAKSWHEADPEKRTAEQAAEDALRYMNAVQRAREGLPSSHTVRYEDLTADPAGELQRICDHLDLEFEPRMLEYGGAEGGLTKGLGDWKDKIRSGSVQPGRTLPGADEIPELLHDISRTWGYLDEKAGDRTATGDREGAAAT